MPDLSSSLRIFDDEKRKAVGEEIARLLAVGFIKEVLQPEWIANLLSVKTHRRVATGNTRSQEAPGLLVGPGPSVNGPRFDTRPGVWVARRAT
jgi:hypothetical protein